MNTYGSSILPIITIEAEESASKEEITPESAENLGAKKPGTMTFLDQQEQDKVRQLLYAYQQKEMKDNGCQTELYICKCQEVVVQRLEKIEQNVEKILMFMERSKHEEKISGPEKQILESGEFLFNSDPVYAFDNNSIEDSGSLPSLAEISNVLNIDETLPGMETSTIYLSKIATPSNQSPITPTVHHSVPAGLLKSASQSTPANPSTQQSTPAISSTQQSTPANPSTQQSTLAIPSTQQSTPVILSTQQSTPVILSTQQSTPAISSTQQSTPANPSTQQSTPAIPSTQ
ncbi:Hypothetical predicted protein, partial [Paramuricea clavata]